MKRKGFTLVELIITITLLAIIGITIGISLNKVYREVDEKKVSKYEKNVINLYLNNDHNQVHCQQC